MPEPVAADLDGVDRSGPSGALWSLPHGGDLDANLVRLGPGDAIEPHRNDAVDVLVVVIAGRGTVHVDATALAVAPHSAVLVPKGTTRAITTDGAELVYMTIHRSRPALGITPR